MQRRLNARRMRRVAATVVAIGALAGAACGGSKHHESAAPASKAAAPTGDGDSAYCHAEANWAARDLDARDESNAAGERVYWTDYIDHVKRTHDMAPAAIAKAWDGNASYVVNRVYPLIQKYGYTSTRFEKEASADEKHIVFEGTDQQQADDGAISAYDSAVCGALQPAPADVKFTGSKTSAFCVEDNASSEAFKKNVSSNGGQIDATRAFFESAGFKALMTADKHAPAEIKDDVAFDETFLRTQFLPTLQRYGYDFRKVLTTGSVRDRQIINDATPEAAPHYARLFAYSGQVCGGDA